MQVITIATNLDHPFLNQLLIPSCNAAGLTLTVLHPDVRQFSFKDKRAIVSRYLSRCDAPDELILFTDAYDTMILRDAEFIARVYASFRKPVVFSAEPNSWPMGAIGLALHTGPPARPYPYLNSGGFIGRAGDLRGLLTKYPDPPSAEFSLLRHLREHGYDADKRFGHSDQYYWTLVRLIEPECIAIDHTAALFENFTAPVGDVADAGVKAAIKEFRDRGRDAASYQQECDRLLTRLQSPSPAAQLHFASAITKRVLLDLWREGRIPDWLRALDGGERSTGCSGARIQEVVIGQDARC
jgi:hypothetical protein